jgi:sugar phosphate isomerase/epimerase
MGEVKAEPIISALRELKYGGLLSVEVLRLQPEAAARASCAIPKGARTLLLYSIM